MRTTHTDLQVTAMRTHVWMLRMVPLAVAVLLCCLPDAHADMTNSKVLDKAIGSARACSTGSTTVSCLQTLVTKYIKYGAFYAHRMTWHV